MSIELANVSKKIKNEWVLKDITLQMKSGKIYGITGNNGSGKSMLMKAICGFIEINQGSIKVNDTAIIGGKQYIKNAGIIIESPDFLYNLTGYENLKVLGDIKKEINDTDIISTLSLVGLNLVKHKKVKNYSLGMKQRLRIAQAIMESPDILILDEPFNGLDKQGVLEIQEILLQYKNETNLLILTSHDERNIDFLCDIVYEMSEGEIKWNIKI